jgi:hypothetical protein
VPKGAPWLFRIHRPVNPAELFDDFVQGFKRYVSDLGAGDPKVVMFEKMFQHVFIDGK